MRYLEPRETLDSAIIGIVEGRLVYYYDLLVPAYHKLQPQWQEHDVFDWIDYNVLSMIPSREVENVDDPIIALAEYDPDMHEGEEHMIITVGEKLYISY